VKVVDLIAEGKRLAKPCIYLRDKGEGNPVAAWGGASVIAAPYDTARHWITLDISALPKEFGLTGSCASVFSDEEMIHPAAFVVSEKARFHVGSGSIPLFAHSTLSMPPIDAVFRFGSPAVHAWLAENHWEPDWGYNDNFRDNATANAYESAFQNQCPLYTGGAHAVLGGWHLPWPDEEWADRLNDKLVLCTFEDSEPWVEVWANGHSFEVIERIT
jgi:hypothetical protein